MVLSEVLITFLVTSAIGCTLAILKVFYKFKFTNISFCHDCLTIQRDTQAEESIDELRINRNITSPRSDATTNKTNSITL